MRGVFYFSDCRRKFCWFDFHELFKLFLTSTLLRKPPSTKCTYQFFFVHKSINGSSFYCSFPIIEFCVIWQFSNRQDLTIASYLFQLFVDSIFYSFLSFMKYILACYQNSSSFQIYKPSIFSFVNQVEVIIMEFDSSRKFVQFSENKKSQQEQHEKYIQIIIDGGFLKVK